MYSDAFHVTLSIQAYGVTVFGDVGRELPQIGSNLDSVTTFIFITL